MKLIRTLDNGKTLFRDYANQVWLYDERGVLMDQVEKGGLASQLLALTPQDFGEVPPPESISTVSVAGPVSRPPRREPYPWYKRALNRLRGL